jgi:hypothetical protein
VLLLYLPHASLLPIHKGEAGLGLGFHTIAGESEGVDAISGSQCGRPDLNIALINHCLGLALQKLCEVVLDLCGRVPDLQQQQLQGGCRRVVVGGWLLISLHGQTLRTLQQLNVKGRLVIILRCTVVSVDSSSAGRRLMSKFQQAQLALIPQQWKEMYPLASCPISAADLQLQ